MDGLANDDQLRIVVAYFWEQIQHLLLCDNPFVTLARYMLLFTVFVNWLEIRKSNEERYRKEEV